MAMEGREARRHAVFCIIIAHKRLEQATWLPGIHTGIHTGIHSSRHYTSTL